jgi:hypothetical protein
MEMRMATATCGRVLCVKSVLISVLHAHELNYNHSEWLRAVNQHSIIFYFTVFRCAKPKKRENEQKCPARARTTSTMRTTLCFKAFGFSPAEQ